MVADSRPGYLRHQDISNHRIDYAPTRISITYAISVLNNYTKYMWILMFSKPNSSRLWLKDVVKTKATQALILNTGTM